MIVKNLTADRQRSVSTDSEVVPMRFPCVTAVGVAALSAAAVFAGAGVAHADEYTGTSYSDASSLLSSRGATPVVATVYGSTLPLDDCIVTSWRQSMFLDAGHNGAGRSNEILLNLNCNAAVASPGVPGNSAASPEGARAKKDDENAAYIRQDPTACYANDENLQYCQRICDKTKKCEV